MEWAARISGAPRATATSGVRRITRFDPSAHAVQVAGEVVGFRREHVRGAQGPPARLARGAAGASAVEEALEDAGIDPQAMTRDELRGIGVIVGSGGGSQEFHRGTVPPLLHRPPEAVQRVHHSHRHHRHAGQRSFHAVRLSRHEPHHLDRLHFVHRRLGYAYRNIQAAA